MKKSADTFSSIVAILNHSPFDVKTELKRHGVSLRIVPGNSTRIPEDDEDHVYGFTSSEALANNMNRLRRPPILWETATVVHHVSLNHPVVMVDAKRHADGLVMFTSLDVEALVELLNQPFKKKFTFLVEKSQPVQYGNHSKFSTILNAFLVTLPSFTVEPTLTALATALKFDYTVFNTYLTSNRLVTTQNKKAFDKLNEIITECQPIIEALRKKDKKFLTKLGEADGSKQNAQRIRFLFVHYGARSLNSYLDDEHNVNQVEDTE